MRFGRTLRHSIYEPWKVHYIDYEKLKSLLREYDDKRESLQSQRGDQEWTEEDEVAFVEELINVQLEKVNAFQVETYKSLGDSTANCEAKLERLMNRGSKQRKHSAEEEERGENRSLQVIADDLDSITHEVNELEKYSRVNFTGFLKAAKKHDRRRGSKYRVRPILQVRSAALPFNSEDYSPLLYRLSVMYSFIRQRLGGTSDEMVKTKNNKHDGEKYRSHKFWVHPDNLFEVKTYILRRLPLLIYNPQTSKVAGGSQEDPTITSVYFDNSRFLLYSQKVERAADASSLRLRWSGTLDDKTEVSFEKKTIHDNGDSHETRFPIKNKYIQSFLQGDHKLEKLVQKMRDRYGNDEHTIETLKKNINDVQTFIRDNNLQTVLRANYTRTAFQVPGDDRVRISLDTNLALIREDSFDADRPCRKPAEWHRTDIDSVGMEFPFTGIRKGEISRFPYALLDIKVKDGGTKRTNEWLDELMSSHFVKEAPRFSKFVHGIAQLFEDSVNSFPFWLGDLEMDIRKDPKEAFHDEQAKKAKQAEDQVAVGSLLGSKLASSFQTAAAPPLSSSPAQLNNQDGIHNLANRININHLTKQDNADNDRCHDSSNAPQPSSGFRSLIPALSTSKYARSRRRFSEQLPSGVRKPGHFIKDDGPVRVEPKVWLANQRTFIKWQNISALLASLSLSLYNAAGKGNSVARGLGVVYTLFAAFAGLWGWWMYIKRSQMIQKRSGNDFDNVVGPIVICTSLVVGLCLNFGLKYRAPVDTTDRWPFSEIRHAISKQHINRQVTA